MKQASKIFSTMIAAVALSACAAGAGYTPRTPAAFGEIGDRARAKKVAVVFQITIPRAAAATKARYVSPATQSIVFRIEPKKGPPKIASADLTNAANRHCKPSESGLLCSVTVALLPGRYRASVATYDGLLNAFHNPTGKELSANQRLPFTVRPNGLTLGIDLALYGTPAAVAVLPAADSTLSGNMTAGYVIPKCSARQRVSVFGSDADGNIILGQGAPRVSLASDNNGQLVVTPPSQASPNEFELSPPPLPAYPFARFTVHLTATAKPPHNGGSAARTQNVNVTYNGDICGVITEFALSNSASTPAGIVTGPDGALWFTESTANKIGRITTSGSYTAGAIPTAASQPQDIALGPDGALWFTEFDGDKIGRVNATTGAISETALPEADSEPEGITSGPDSAMWFTEHLAQNIGEIQGSTITEFPTPLPFGAEITAGPDGNLYSTNSDGALSIVFPLLGTAEYFVAPNSGAAPNGIAFAPNGAIYYTDLSAGAIGYWFPQGEIVTFFTPTAASAPVQIRSGPDGAMWFTELIGNRIGRIAPDHTIAETVVPTADSGPYGITVGPDGALWFTESRANKVARLW